MSVGYISFGASATVATFSMASEATLTSGDVLTVVAPGTSGGTLSDLAINTLGAQRL